MHPADPRLPHETPGFEQVALALIEEDVGLRAFGEASIRATLSGVPFERAFALCSRLDKAIRDAAAQGLEAEAQIAATSEIFRGHVKHAELVDLVVRERRRPFSTPYIHAIQRLLVYEADNDDPTDTGFLSCMQQAFLGICNVVSPAARRPNDFEFAHHLALMMRAMVSAATEPNMEALSRAYAIYYELPRRPDAPTWANYLPRERWEPDPALAPTVHERFMLGMAVLGAVTFHDPATDPGRPVSVPAAYFQRLVDDLEHGGDVERLTSSIAATQEQWRDAFEAHPADLRNTAANAIPFQARPLLRQAGNADFLLSSVAALESWMTRGVHYACLSSLEGSVDAPAFLAWVGRLFERYAIELMESAHQQSGNVRVLGEQPYNRGSSRTSDIGHRNRRRPRPRPHRSRSPALQPQSAAECRPAGGRPRA